MHNIEQSVSQSETLVVTKQQPLEYSKPQMSVNVIFTQTTANSGVGADGGPPLTSHS